MTPEINETYTFKLITGEELVAKINLKKLIQIKLKLCTNLFYESYLVILGKSLLKIFGENYKI